MMPRSTSQTLIPTLLVTIIICSLISPAEAFGAGYVARGSPLKATKFRHGDIALAIPLLATANRRLVKQIYFGNWLRDFSQLLDRSSLALVPQPILRALVSIFTFVQFGYATRQFEVTDERLGFYRPEEHVDNPRGYNNGSQPVVAEAQEPTVQEAFDGLRDNVQPIELDIDPTTAMKNYIASSTAVGGINETSADYVEKQLVAAIACGRQGDEEAYIHLGAALHTLEDFAAHSNYVELAMQRLGAEIEQQANVTPALKNVFAYVGGAAHVETALGPAPPIVTGTFGALDLYQTLLGEIDDKLSAMSLPGLETRTSDQSGPLHDMAKHLVSLLGGLTPQFTDSINKVGKSTPSTPATWGELESKPELLWQSIEPVFKLRDDIVKWVYDHLTIPAVQDAIAKISIAIDKLVYMVLGIVLRPILMEISKVLRYHERELLVQDQEARLSAGQQSIFDEASKSTDPTHSQLAKDHYDHTLNEIAGRVATRISSFAVTSIVQLWQPGNTQDPVPSIRAILDAFHHPFNSNVDSTVQVLMLDEVRTYIQDRLTTDLKSFELQLHSLSAPEIAARGGGHTHVDAPTSAQARVAVLSEQEEDNFRYKMSENIKRQLTEGKVKGMGLVDFSQIKEMFDAAPTGKTPNPLDTGLALLPSISFLSTFKDISVDEISTVDGMGETLKDAIITMILLDETRAAEEAEIAAMRFRSKNGGDEKAMMRELGKMLELPRSKTVEDEGQFEKKKGVGEKLREGFGKLKVKAGGKS